MAELKLSAVWKINGFAEQNSQIKDVYGEYFYGELPELRHVSLPGLQWAVKLYTSSPDERKCQNGFVGFYLVAQFGASDIDAKCVWTNFTATLLVADDQDMITSSTDTGEFTSQKGDGKFCGRGLRDFFQIEDVHKAVRKDGSLCIHVILRILKIGEILQCRELLREMLANKTETDFNIKVGEETFTLHKSVLAGTSTVFARMFECGMEEAADGVLTLPDTTPAAFKAFEQSIYFDNWDFLADIDLTQEVLYLAEKFNVGNLKRYCDESLAEKISEANALEILTKSAALCNAEKTKAACSEILAEDMEFKKSAVWLDFKKRNRGIALEILDEVSDKLMSANKKLKLEKRQLEVKCEENKKASNSKRRRK